MAEATQIVFTYRELVTAMVKEQGIHEGIWALYVHFGLQAQNFGPTLADIVPTAVLPILHMGLQKADKESNIAVDASKVNPKGTDSKRRQK